ncbi:hypothetical protein M427DRAFT_27319 [Gonapodya prolifera JEL478]|uniref:Uncharacterized protein n=1 Tax=Gonapodya prolifera (strain JEL478) TaxID=1344416 RepID=A0A139AYC1_GONPJ|nr:hypothetical protein M427DRAFT_27319 [Gonapodya prolifera JEL478]|eukprot:KXS21736.1 hypothetical protein M427DRAFT_27319 [Gonapodya prolifera JEL478]
MAPKQKQRKPEYGVVFPVPPGVEPPPNGAPRSTTWANQEVLAVAVENHDADLARAIRAEKNWRNKYKDYYVKMVELSLKSPETGVSIARTALSFCENSFEFVRPDQPAQSLREAFDQRTPNPFETRTVRGKGERKSVLEVPYKGKILSGNALLSQLDEWVERGTIEPDARDAVSRVLHHPPSLNLSSSPYTFILLGAGAAMGCLYELLNLGACVVAVDLDAEGVWKRIAKVAEAGAGEVVFPVRQGGWKAKGWNAGAWEGAGANLITEGPEIKEWLLSVIPPDSQPVICNYAYLDGPAHVKVALAMDGIGRALCEALPAATLGYLCTPTDCHVIPREALEGAKKNLEGLWLPWLVRHVGKLFGPVQVNVRDVVTSVTGEEFAVVDGLMTRQGPNYAFAKRIQHWRAMVAREDWRVRVSSNVAPMTRTLSVIHNIVFRFAYGGAHHFAPAEIFEPSTSTSLMCALLLHDLLPSSPASPTTPLRHPLEIMSRTSAHGGVWRTSIAIDSVGEYAAALYLADPRNWGGEMKRAMAKL